MTMKAIANRIQAAVVGKQGLRLSRRSMMTGLACIISALLPVAAAQAQTQAPLSKWLVGTWLLESFTSTDDKGVVTDAMGPGAQGYLSYSSDGWMSVQLARAGRKPFAVPDMDGGTTEQTVEAARTYFAYAGWYAVDEQNHIVYHNLLFSLMPNWVGSKQKRYVRTEGDDTLVLSGDPVLIGGKVQVTQLRWRRRAAPAK
ncbi:hypothetical protein CKO43_23685 [Rubrivivax gelatinosus]|uniref:Lipocalin-like domain-containing protein n=2 Tax=Rubrivivax gelatinosus TaxID=28068 RepID=A0ABS1E499_RUBGE|nr:hypothetical protein [Rubrivivax gelatinosus]